MSAEQSVQLHVGDKTVPAQLLMRSPKGRNQPTLYIHNTSVLDIRTTLPNFEHCITVDRLRLYTVAASLVFCSRQYFIQQPIQMRTLLSTVPDASEILPVLLSVGYMASAARLAGGFRNIGRPLIADHNVKGMSAADYNIKEIDPFEDKSTIQFGRREVSVHANRLSLLWQTMRSKVIEHFPDIQPTAVDVQAYLLKLEDKFVSDAYHSLFIEDYKVTPELIERVKKGQWNPEQSDEHKKHLDGMAVKGYWDAFAKVKNSVEQVLQGKNSGEVLEADHLDWYLALFGPSVVAGIARQSDLAGYRTGPVFIRQSKHTPPNKEALRDMMPTLFDLLMQEKNGPVRIVLGHFMFVYIHHISMVMAVWADS
ncbi:hypothetical protein [Marinicellulosiphila megalodicopiae]|uniref:hypothetical protein n=1 Tax=Marinicellulosiphila megalodicopiae TaxID=2724896 RepID=UPI003BAF5446